MTFNKAAATPWLPNYRPNPGARLRLFCFPYAGGASLIYRNWSARLPPLIDVCPVQLPGRGARLREAPYTSHPALVQTMADALAPYFDKQFAFFGHSMGATLAFELTRELRRRGRPRPVHLFVSGRSAAQLNKRRTITYNLPEPEFIEQLRKLEGTPEEVLSHPELMEVMMPLLRADFEIVETYKYEPEPPLDCPVTALGGLTDAEATREEVDAWREQTSTSFSLRMLPGGHFFINTAQPQVLQVVAHELHRYL